MTIGLQFAQNLVKFFKDLETQQRFGVEALQIPANRATKLLLDMWREVIKADKLVHGDVVMFDQMSHVGDVCRRTEIVAILSAKESGKASHVSIEKGRFG